MRHSLIIRFAPERTHEIDLRADGPAMPADEARRWLDEQFVAQECEPLRGTGKVLTADKVMALAQTVAPAKFTDDPAWAGAFARATLSALGRPLVTVDLDARAISY
ncbi:MAG: hypothetical protein C0505_01855 [Leptothrix sp. (in: Bacteria)]|nr:hypothetical protein [Leptothrix sp. (in: b-proteobacteria)]